MGICQPLGHCLLVPGDRQVWALLPWPAARHWAGVELALVLQTAYQRGLGKDPETLGLEAALLRWIPVVGMRPRARDLPWDTRQELWGEGAYLQFVRQRLERFKGGNGIPLRGLGDLTGLLLRAGVDWRLAWELDLADLLACLRLRHDPEEARLEELGAALERELTQDPSLEALIWPTQAPDWSLN